MRIPKNLQNVSERGNKYDLVLFGYRHSHRFGISDVPDGLTLPENILKEVEKNGLGYSGYHRCLVDLFHVPVRTGKRD